MFGRRLIVPIVRWRVHHGLAGLALITGGIAMCAHDWHDRRVWVSDFRRAR